MDSKPTLQGNVGSPAQHPRPAGHRQRDRACVPRSYSDPRMNSGQLHFIDEKGSESLCDSPKVVVRGFKPSAIQLLGPGEESQPLNSQSTFKGVWDGVRCMLDQKGEEEISQVKTSLKRSSLAPLTCSQPQTQTGPSRATDPLALDQR